MPLPEIEVAEYNGVVGLAITNDDMEELLFVPMKDVPAFVAAVNAAYNEV